MVEVLIIVMILSFWAVACVTCAVIGYHKGKKDAVPKKIELSTEQKRKLDKEQRELMNFYTYNGDTQGH